MAARRVALIHQAGSFCNPGVARRLAKSGHDLVLHAPRPGMVEELEALGAALEVIAADALPDHEWSCTPAGAALLVERALARFGHIDAAALLPPRGWYPGSIRGRLLDAPIEHIAAIGGYFEATAHLLRAVIPAMSTRGGGQILVYTSDSGARPEAGWCLYGAARAGQNFLVQAVALEHAGEGICINALGSKNAITAGFPGAPADAVRDDKVTPGAWSKHLVAETPLGRLGTMEELAAFATVLLDGSNRFQTAQYFSFSGGWCTSGTSVAGPNADPR
jgi:NAD(P)-dependent dehydrogenase (short-subunit alcohol dehydrogenase family)